MAARVRPVHLDSIAYQDMLQGYMIQRLKLSPEQNPEDQGLIQAILDAADNRFAYVAFLTERCGRGKESRESLRQAGSGNALYVRWLQGLNIEYGRKLAGRMCQIMAILGAAQQAHDWVFGAGRIEDPATGGALTPLDENFSGIGLPVLQTLLMLDRPWSNRDDERYDPGLLFTLQHLQGVLAIHRGGEGESRFRIGLKDFGPLLSDDADLAPMIQAAHARMATVMMDAVQALADGGDTRVDWPVFKVLAPLQDANVTLSGSELVGARWGNEQPDAVSLLASYDNRWKDACHTLLRIPGLSLLAVWAVSGSEEYENQKDNHYADHFMNRGLARLNGGDLAGAETDFGAGIKIRESIRDQLLAEGGETAWSLSLRNDLAGNYLNRGVSRANGDDSVGAMVDYGAGIEICEGIRDQLLAEDGETVWNTSHRNKLATMYQNRGNVRANCGDLTEAIVDYGVSIEIGEGIRDQLLAEGGGEDWSLSLRNDLARIYQNRGIARLKGGDLAGAVADYDVSIDIGEGIRGQLLSEAGEMAWRVYLLNSLAGIYYNRGIARTIDDDLAGAVSDYDASIEIREGIRDQLLEEDDEAAWSVPLRNDLALNYCVKACSLDPEPGRKTLTAAEGIANKLNQLGFTDAAQSVYGRCDKVKQHWLEQENQS